MNHYLFKEGIRMKFIGITTVKREKIWLALQEKNRSQWNKDTRKYTYFVYNATPSSQWQNPHFTKKATSRNRIIK
jgi:hypothetical protein